MDLSQAESGDLFDVNSKEVPKNLARYELALQEFKTFFRSLTAIKKICCSASVASRLPALPSLLTLQLVDDDCKGLSLSELSGCVSLRSFISKDTKAITNSERAILGNRVDISRMPNLENIDFHLINPKLKSDTSKHYLAKLCDTQETTDVATHQYLPLGLHAIDVERLLEVHRHVHPDDG
jgi:hypothetical protein